MFLSEINTTLGYFFLLSIIEIAIVGSTETVCSRK